MDGPLGRAATALASLSRSALGQRRDDVARCFIRVDPSSLCRCIQIILDDVAAVTMIVVGFSTAARQAHPGSFRSHPGVGGTYIERLLILDMRRLVSRPALPQLPMLVA